MVCGLRVKENKRRKTKVRGWRKNSLDLVNQEGRNATVGG